MCVYKTDDGVCKKYSDNDVLSYCVCGPCDDEVESNADKIRSMTDEELAEWLEYEGGGACAEVFRWLDWLKQPAEGE